MSCKIPYEKTEDNSIAYLKTKNCINVKTREITDINTFRQANTFLTNLAKTKYGVEKGRLFTEAYNTKTKKLKYIFNINKDAMEEIDKVKYAQGIVTPTEVVTSPFDIKSKTEVYYKGEVYPSLEDAKMAFENDNKIQQLSLDNLNEDFYKNTYQQSSKRLTFDKFKEQANIYIQYARAYNTDEDIIDRLKCF